MRRGLSAAAYFLTSKARSSRAARSSRTCTSRAGWAGPITGGSSDARAPEVGADGLARIHPARTSGRTRAETLPRRERSIRARGMRDRRSIVCLRTTSSWQRVRELPASSHALGVDLRRRWGRLRSRNLSGRCVRAIDDDVSRFVHVERGVREPMPHNFGRTQLLRHRPIDLLRVHCSGSCCVPRRRFLPGAMYGR